VSIFTRKVPVNKLRERAAGRLERISRAEVLDWTDVSLSGVWKALEDYRKEPAADLLEEAERGLQMALGAVDDLRRRDSPA
jgi:hypothetical protein